LYTDLFLLTLRLYLFFAYFLIRDYIFNVHCVYKSECIE
jgi:hypothetical protein